MEKRSENELTSMKKQSEERLKEIEKQSEERLKKTEKQSKDNLTEIESLLEDIKNKHKSVNNLSEHYDNLAKNVYEKEKEVDKFCSLISKKMQSIEITADSGFDKKFTGREANYEINSKVSDGINYLNKDFSLASEEASAKLINFQEQKKKEETNIEVLMSYNLSVLPDYPSILKELVTINRMEEIKKFLMYFQDHRILLLTGTGGIGKTTIARALIDLRPENVPVPFWFDFRQNKDVKLGDILEKLASYMNCPEIAKFRVEKREAEKKDIDKLTDKLQIENPVWLIFDSLETILDDVYFHDEDMDLFFTCLHNSTHQAKIIITSRISPTFKSGEYLVDGIEEEKQDIKGLNTNFAVEYLVKNGLGNLDSNKLEELAKGVDGHPLALQLLVGVIKKFGVSDTLEDLTIYKRLKEGTIKKTRKLFEKLAGDQKELLERVSVFRQAEPMDAIKIMFTDKTPVEAIDKLIDKSLLETDHKGKYWLHPLVQEISYEELKNKKEAHLIAYSYYKSVVLHESPTKKEDLQPVIEAFYHACEAEEYDLAADVIWEFNLQYLLDLWGYSRTLIEIYEKLLPKDHIKDEPLLEDKQVHGAVLGNLGLAYSDLDEPRKAIEYHKQALEISKKIGNRYGEGADLGNLGLTYSDLGESRKAIEYYEQALKIAKEIGDRRNEGTWLGNLGIAYKYLGELRKAIEYYEQALKISKEIEDRYGEGVVLDYLGNAYSNLGDPRKAIEYHEQALKISRKIGDRRREGICLGNLGGEYIKLGKTKKAIEYCEQGLKIAREIGDRRSEGYRFMVLGSAYRDLGETKKAIEFLKESLAIGKLIEDPR